MRLLSAGITASVRVPDGHIVEVCANCVQGVRAKRNRAVRFASKRSIFNCLGSGPTRA